ncbi:hypothetical protein FT663_01011 [Candidozyma haemuli var. vulneris]|nr:hypothetical protein FT662_01582 [[Candida] haemuloni var. vulneris]KAF3994906.1 hypothetical protein FT663_01011 [[Candida] haemuloni var. vulneris]
MHPVLFWAAVVVGCWVAVWLLVYKLTGGWLGYVSINNGISLNYLYFESKHVNVYATSVRLRLWGNSKRIIVTDLRVEILPSKGPKTSSPRKPKDSSDSTCDAPEPISILPSRLRWLFRFILWHLPTIILELKSSKLILSRDVVDLENIILTSKKEKAAHRKDYLNLLFDMAGYGIESSPKSASSKVPPLSIGTFNIMTKTIVDTSSGIINNTIVQLYLDNSEIGAFQILRHLFQEQDDHDTPSSSSNKEDTRSREEKLQRLLDKLTLTHQRVSSTIKEISLNICNSRILGIPCIPTSSTCDLDEYFSHIDPPSSFSVSVKSMAIQASHLTDKAAGFMALFNSKRDRPLHLTASIVLFQSYFVTRRFDEVSKLWHSDVDEFLNVPNLSFTFKSNFLDHLARGLGFRDCSMEFYSSISNPILDLSVDQIALLSYNRVLAKKVLILRKLKRDRAHSASKASSSQSPSSQSPTASNTDGEDSNGEFSSHRPESSPDTPVAHKFDGPYKTSDAPPTTLLDKAVSLLNEYYPQIGVKCAVEQPQYVIRLDETEVKLIDISYSLMYFHLLTTANNDYDARCHVLHPCLKYSRKIDVPDGDENPRLSEEVVGCNNAELQFHVLKNLRFKVSALAENAFVNLAKPDVLNGINEIASSMTKKSFDTLRNGSVNQFFNKRLVEDFGSEPSDIHHHGPAEKSSSMDKLYRTLPSWFVSADVELKGLKATLGSTSPLLPPELIAELSQKSETLMSDTDQVIELKIEHHCVSISNNDHAPDINTIQENSSSDSSETLAFEEQNSLYWKISSCLKNFQLNAKKRNAKDVPLLLLDNVEASLSAVRKEDGNEMVVDTNLNEITGTIDRRKVFTILGSIHLILQTVIIPVKNMRSEINKDLEKFERHERRGSVAEGAKAITFQLNLKKMNYIAKLSDEFKLRLQAFDFSVISRQNVLNINIYFLRLLADSPQFKGMWSRLGCVDSINVKLNDPQESEKISIFSSHVRFFQPHGFVVYKLFDNISIFVKIIKHLVKCLKSSEKSTVVFPNESLPLKVPNIRFKSTNLSYLMEDDPFEADLGMHFQLGLVEQRKRMDMLSAFEEKVKQENLSEAEFDVRLDQMRVAISDSWIRKVNAYKAAMASELTEHGRYIVGNELDLPASDNHKVLGYFIAPPLLKIVMADFDILITSPEFPLEELPQYIYNVGQGVPTDTRYNLMVPTHIDMCVNELRIHLRDYPLPLLHLPRAKDEVGRGRALMMKGHLVIGEALCLEKEHLRQMEVQLREPSENPDDDLHKYDHLTINKSLTTVKVFTDLDVKFDSNGPCRFVWGQAYQFGIQQAMLNFDSFSKPPVDPSNKLGFWDKMRMLLHGKFSIRAEGSTQVEVAFKGGRDPYDLFPKSSGFILSFQDHVIWRINHEDNSLKFFDISAQRVSWYIPNYLAAPLMAWTRDSSDSVFLPDFHKMTNTVHAYYLIRTPPHSTAENATNPDINIKEKMAIELSGGIRYVVGFLLQRQAVDGGVTEDCIPHYDIVPFNPEFTSENHDTYKGFRSTKLHMSMSLAAHTEDSYNTIHLSPGGFDIFFKWWKMFQGNMMLPIRKGIVFGEKKASPKFSQHLFTNKFLFQIRNLFISHIYREEYFGQDDDYIDCFGLRARVKDFVVDLHQQKEERISLHRPSGKEIKTLKMIMKLGEVSLSEIDMRVVLAKIYRDTYSVGEKSSREKCKLKIFDDNKQWFDPRDFHEAFKSNSHEAFKSVEVTPMAYSERFAYIRDTTDMTGGNNDSAEKSHDCKLNTGDIHSAQISVAKRRQADLEEIYLRQGGVDLERRINSLKLYVRKFEDERERSSRRESTQSVPKLKEHFHNRFLITSMLFKWNVKVRDIFTKYLLFAEINSKARKFLSYEFVSMLEGLVNKQDNQSDRLSVASSSIYDTHSRGRKLSHTSMKVGSSQERLNNFDAILREITGDERIAEDFKIEVIGVQIQFHTEQVIDTVSIVSAPLLESKIVSVLPKSDNPLIINTTVPEKRYGVLLHDASVTVLEKKDVDHWNPILDVKPWGSKSNWPPWLGIETCRDNAHIDPTLMPIERMSVMVTYDKVNASASEMEHQDNDDDNRSQIETLGESASSAKNKLRVDIPRVSITSTSKQYLALYATALNLFHYSDPITSQLKDKLSKLNFQTEFSDYKAMHDRLTKLHSYMLTLKVLSKGYGYRHEHLDNEELNSFLFLNSEIDDTNFEILFTVEALLMRDAFSDSSKSTVADWIIGTDEVVLHMLQDDRKPILDLAIEGGTCKRVIMEDGSNDNRIQIKNIQGNNLVKGAPYKRFVESVYAPGDENLILVDWSMQKPVGGIKIIENFEINSKPLKIRFDEITGVQLMQFIFQTDKEDEIENSVLIRMNDGLKDIDEADKPGNGEKSKKNKKKKKKKNSADGSGEDEDDGDLSDSGSLASTTVISNRESKTFDSRTQNKTVKKKGSLKESSFSSGDDGDFGEDVARMIERSKKYFSVTNMNFRPFDVMISLKLKSGLWRLLNVTDFMLELPGFHVEKELVSMLDIGDLMKKMLIKSLLSHSGRLLKNMLKTSGRNRKKDTYYVVKESSNQHTQIPSSH